MSPQWDSNPHLIDVGSLISCVSVGCCPPLEFGGVAARSTILHSVSFRGVSLKKMGKRGVSQVSAGGKQGLPYTEATTEGVGPMQNDFSGKRFDSSKRTGRKRESHFGSKPSTHGGGASTLSWIGGALFVLGIVLGASTQSGPAFWVFAGLAVQLWIVAAVIRPLEAIWTLLNERLSK